MSNTEFIDGETYDKIIADLRFYINGIEYHIEFQTAYDNSVMY